MAVAWSARAAVSLPLARSPLVLPGLCSALWEEEPETSARGENGVCLFLPVLPMGTLCWRRNEFDGQAVTTSCGTVVSHAFGLCVKCTEQAVNLRVLWQSHLMYSASRSIMCHQHRW